MTYDFKRLSGADFEEIVHDLLQEDWKTELEIFAGGRDGGVDLRRVTPDELLIVQCKNYEGSGYNTLKAKMRNEELVKIAARRPDRYVLVTSVDLTVAQKDELFSLLTPWVVSKKDIIGKTELCAKLASHDDVVRRHHKLWLTSVAVMEQIMLGAERVQTSADINRMQRKLDVYVETDALRRAVDILNSNKVVIISGEPGIGKSTLADMIMLDHIANLFQPAIIRSSLNEGRALAASGRPTIFYFDDFLGQTYLGDRPDFLGKREDADLVAFIEWVRHSEKHRFVLTTREHILTEALMRSERLRHADLNEDRCVITIKDLSRGQKARILYNHLEFSDLPVEYKTEILKDDFYLKVVDYEGFSPRVIQWLSSYNRLRSVPVERYQGHVEALMKNPLEIWRHAFEHELSQAAREILVVLYSFTYRAYVDDLKKCFDTFHSYTVRRLNERAKSGAFHSAMKELDGSFIIINKQNEVRFINPSIADYVATVLVDDQELIIDLFRSAIYFAQISSLLDSSAEDGPLSSAMPRISQNGELVASSFDRVLDTPQWRWFNVHGENVGYYVDMAYPDRLHALLTIEEYIPSVRAICDKALNIFSEKLGKFDIRLSQSRNVIKRIFAFGVDSRRASPVISAMNTCLVNAYSDDWLMMLDMREQVGQRFDECFPELDELFQYFLRTSLQDERESCDSVQNAAELLDTLERLLDHGADVPQEIKRVEALLADLEQREAAYYSDDTNDEFFGSSPEASIPATDDELRSMFGGLLH
jgi:hypothetical protein